MSSGYPPGAQYPHDPSEGQDPWSRREDATMPGGERQPVRLRMQLGPTIGQVYTMLGNTLTLGRAQDNDVVLDDPQVSRHHARVLRRGDQIIVEDLGSTNGTLVNGRRITGQHVLQPTETIAVGASVFSVEGFPAPNTVAVRPLREKAAPPQPAREQVQEPQSSGGSPWLAIGWLGGLLIVVVLILTLAGLTAWLLTRDRVQVTPTTPSVFIQAPVAGSQVPVNQPVVVNATASDPDGITRVELWVGGNVVDQQQSAVPEGQPTFPVTLSWTPTVAGSYTLEIRAYDSQGTVSPPTTVMITVVGGPVAGVVTPTPRAPTETPAPVGPPVALTTTDLNVREGPGENYPVVGLLPVNTEVEVTGKDPDAIWWQIAYPPGTGQRAWIYAPFTRTSHAEDVPMVETPVPPTLTPTITSTPTTQPTSTSTPTPTPTVTPPLAPIVEFGATKTTIDPGQCTTLQWHIENVTAAYLNGGEFSNFGVTGPVGSREVCPSATTLYILRAETSAGLIERSVTVTVRAEQSVTLNSSAGGWVRQDGAIFTPQPFVGDDSTNQALRAFMAFDLSSLAGKKITSAQLDLSGYDVEGAPFDSLRPLYVEEVDWGTTLEASDFNLGAAASLATINDANGLNSSIDVTGRVSSHIDSGNNSFRIRLRFEVSTNGNGVNDSIDWAGRPVRLIVGYHE
jgi:pSer/pThr/pTyr-binding forkhead associated (FHA) protein